MQTRAARPFELAWYTGAGPGSAASGRSRWSSISATSTRSAARTSASVPPRGRCSYAVEGGEQRAERQGVADGVDPERGHVVEEGPEALHVVLAGHEQRGEAGGGAVRVVVALGLGTAARAPQPDGVQRHHVVGQVPDRLLVAEGHEHDDRERHLGQALDQLVAPHAHATVGVGVRTLGDKDDPRLAGQPRRPGGRRHELRRGPRGRREVYVGRRHRPEGRRQDQVGGLG